MDRIFIGNDGASQLLRISQPGQDVKNRAARMIFSSDNDYLRVHHRGSMRLTRHPTQDYMFYTGKADFPPLDHFPLAWWRTVSNDRGIDQSYRYPSTTADITTIFTSVVVGKSSIWFSNSDLVNIPVQIDVDFIIFENRFVL